MLGFAIIEECSTPISKEFMPACGTPWTAHTGLGMQLDACPRSHRALKLVQPKAFPHEQELYHRAVWSDALPRSLLNHKGYMLRRQTLSKRPRSSPSTRATC